MDDVLNRQHKDTVFRSLFGAPENREFARSLYNALGGNCQDAREMEVTTLGTTLFLNRHNDVSYLVNDEMVLWEHQPTANENMPLRRLICFKDLYDRHLAKLGRSVQARGWIMLPAPRYVAFCNGTEKRPDTWGLGEAASTLPEWVFPDLSALGQ